MVSALTSQFADSVSKETKTKCFLSAVCVVAVAVALAVVVAAALVCVRLQRYNTCFLFATSPVSITFQ